MGGEGKEMGTFEMGVEKKKMTYKQIETIVDTLEKNGFEINYLNIRLKEGEV